MNNFPTRDFLASGIKEEEIVKSIEKAFRVLPEYEVWTRRNRKMVCEWKDCPVTQEISDLHVHHYPLTLYKIVERIVRNNMGDSPYEILGEIIRMHLNSEVSCITLCRYHHGMYHEMIKKGVDPSPYIQEVVCEVSE